jgi:hypothetical protein
MLEIDCSIRSSKVGLLSSKSTFPYTLLSWTVLSLQIFTPAIYLYSIDWKKPHYTFSTNTFHFSATMFGYLLFAAVAFSLMSYFVIWPVVEYFRDPKGLRKYPNLNFLSGITDLAFIYESHKGFRSHALLEAHQKSPVIRIGPNSLSYSDLAAIKVS